MILCEGRTQEELMQVLQELDEATSMDLFIRNGDKVAIDCKKENGQLRDWKVHCFPSLKHTPLSIGSTYRGFLKKLDQMNEEEELFRNDECQILCYLSTQVNKTWNGLIISKWFMIDPFIPYEIVNGEIKFQTKEVQMREEEFAVMSKTGLAFYNRKSGVYYPITESAFTSLGKLLESQMAFRRVDDHLLGTALILAEKISKLTELRLICRSKKDRLKPVVSIAGRRYQLFSQKKFFEKITQNAAATLGLYKVNHWVIEDDKTSLMLEYSNSWEDFSFYLTFSTGDSNSTPFCAKLDVAYKGSIYTLLSNTQKHENKFSIEDVPNLLFGVEEKMEEYRALHIRLSNQVCSFNEEWLNDIHTLLGKKRVRNLPKIESGCYVAKDLWERILTTRNMSLPERQNQMLEQNLTALVYKIDENSLETKVIA